MFQEWPQLLDPNLDALINPLNNAFLESLHASQADYQALHRRQEEDRFCFPQAVCVMLYSLCNTRGSKVIVRFLSNEAKHLEAILNAYETWDYGTKNRQSDQAPLIWEERYILLLWLSHLLLTPFDLSTVGSGTKTNGNRFQDIEALILPAELPLIAQRLTHVAIDGLSAAGKESEASVLVLVRLALRSDMQRLGVHEILIRWSVAQLKSLQKSKKEAGYFFKGLLSFLASLVKLMDTTEIAPFLFFIFSSIESFGIFQSGSSSALTRKAVIKIYSACSVAALSLEQQPNKKFHLAGLILEPVIEELLSALGDNDTPVRQTASKALSIMATKLDPSMAADISEAVIESLEENVLWEPVKHNTFRASEDIQSHLAKQRNLTLVSPSKWQGLTLTLSQLLFRRCPPVAQLPGILNALILALGFEQRSSTGVSIGTSVRDAACFGIWSLARRYSTAELLAINTEAMPAAKERGIVTSVIQLMAIELLIAATIDPSGNIRRGASAALQELVGRHPDTIVHGIPLVQIVDYHAVALPSRAMKQVAVDAAKLDDLYWMALVRDLTTWRGVGATDVESRRLAADTLGILCALQGVKSIELVAFSLKQSLNDLNGSDIQKKQGFLLALSALVRNIIGASISDRYGISAVLAECWDVLSGSFFTDEELAVHTAHPELTNEAVSKLILELALAVKDSSSISAPSINTIRHCFKYLDFALRRNEEAVLQSAVSAVKALIDATGSEECQTWLDQVMGNTDVLQLSSGSVHAGYLLALSEVHSSIAMSSQNKKLILQRILGAAKPGIDIDTRVVALRGLVRIISCNDETAALPPAVIGTIQSALQDYTTDQRGDVGSLIRLKGIEAVVAAFQKGSLQLTKGDTILLQKVCTLAAEKLDKVREHAWFCLTKCWCISGANQPTAFQDGSPSYASDAGETTLKTAHIQEDDTLYTTSSSYFKNLLNVLRYRGLQQPLLQGLIVSVGGGSESVLLASQKALGDWLYDRAQSSELEEFANCFQNVLQASLEIDRLVGPALDTLAFILDTNIFIGENSKLLQ